MLKTNIFAGGITNLTDARYFAARGAQYLSFNLDEGADLSISSEKTAAIKEWVEGPAFVGAFQMASVEDIQFLVKRLNLQLVQTGPLIPLSAIANNNIEVPLIREIIIEQLIDLSTLEDQEVIKDVFDYVFINFEKNGISWMEIKENQDALSQLKQWSSNTKLILAISHQATETEEMLDMLSPYGLYLQGGAEEKVGFKSFDDLDEILDILENEEY